jgi:hypothetical protein
MGKEEICEVLARYQHPHLEHLLHIDHHQARPALVVALSLVVEVKQLYNNVGAQILANL